MRIKPAVTLFILLLIGITSFLAVTYFHPRDQRLAPKGVISAENNSTGQQAKQSQLNNQKGNRRRFDFTPEIPVNGVLKGVVEIGATGFNSFVIHIDRQNRWEVVAKDFGVSLVYEGQATAEKIQGGIDKHISNMFDNAVSRENIHFLMSSGAQKQASSSKILSGLKNKGYLINTVTADQEGRFGFLATVPLPFRDSSFMVDIGSGNTKISWQEGGNLKTMEAPGAKYYEKNQADEAVYTQVKQQLSSIPPEKRKVCFIIGGVPFMLAEQSRSGEERYTVLNTPGSYKASNKRMASGLNIYRAISDATNCNMFVFDWDSNFVIGYLLSLNEAPK
jgi:hypothetical protein